MGPGSARNRAAAEARGAWLAFTEDDCTPAPDWLARTAARLAAEPESDVLVGPTLKPGGRPVRRRAAEGPDYLPTNLFVRRALFAQLGGFSGAFFDSGRGIYFREDSDFGFLLEEAKARIAFEPGAVVTHPEEHPRFLDPLRWAARYEMDPLLAARHPQRFRERIEVHRIGPLRVRRPVVRASLLGAVTTAVAMMAWARGAKPAAATFAALAVLSLLPLWAKWRFDPRRLPLVPFVPFVLAIALVRGHLRVARLRRAGGLASDRAWPPADRLRQRR
jgi:hypothetical protein